MTDFLMKYAQYIIFLGGILTLFGGFLAGKQAEKDSARNDQLMNESKDLTQRTYDENTGGDSFPFLNVDIYNEGKEIEFRLYNYGKIKLDKVTMEITDGAKGNINELMMSTNFENELEKYTTTKFYDILYPNQSTRIKDFEIDNRFKDICLTIHFKFGNKHLIESIFYYDYKRPDLRRGEAKIVDGNKVLLHYSIDKDFNRTYIVGFNT
jgi:hypothetical protein